MRTRGILIVGAGQAGIELAAALRSAGYDRGITLIGDEARAPYQRPPLSKAWLTGTQDAQSIELRSPEWFTGNGIELVTGDLLVSIDRDETGAGSATTASGRTITFERLALATGASPRQLDCPGSRLPGVHYLRNTSHADALALELDTAKSVVVVGGGFIGLEVAVAARKHGAHVTVLEAAPRLIGRAVAEQTSEFYLNAHRRRGIQILTGARIESFEETDGRVSGVRLAGSDGEPSTIVAADAIVVGIGVVPATEVAESMGLATENGIRVDGRMLASDGTTLAIGDCANMPIPGGARGALERVRLESVPNAAEQARIAAATVLGEEAAYVAIPWFWSDQGELKLQIAGLSHGYDRTILRGDPEDEKFSLLYYRGETLIAADCVNSPRDFMAVKHALKSGVTIPAESAADSTIALKDLVKQAVAVAV
jgi:3-phenylpropionate/trans-cinnamate dioxygenase ferredoxin reductase subunit